MNLEYMVLSMLVSAAIVCVIYFVKTSIETNLLYKEKDYELKIFIDGCVQSRMLLQKLLYMKIAGHKMSYESYQNHSILIDGLIEASEAMNCMARLAIAKEIKRIFLEINHEQEDTTKCL